MIIYTIIEYFLIVIAFVDYKKGLICFAILDLFIGVNIRGYLIPGGNIVAVENILSLVYSIVFLIKHNSLLLEKQRFPLLGPFIFISISMVLSSTLTIAPGNISKIISAIIRQFVMAYIYWKVLDRKSLIMVFYGSCVVFLISTIYAQYEYIFQTNPISDYFIESSVDQENVIDWHFEDNSERGYRVKSIFDHAIGAGVMWALCIFWIFSYCSCSQIFKQRTIKTFAYIVLMIMCFICIIYTRSRSGIVFIMLCMLSFVNFKKSRSFVYGIFILFAIIFLGSHFSQFNDIFMSIFSPKARDTVGGSSIELRFDQLDAAFSLFAQSPILGLGSGFQELVTEDMASRLMGYESMWFVIIPSYGLLGMITNIYLAYVCIIKIPQMYEMKAIKYVCFAYWLVGSLSSLPGMKMHYYYIVIFYLIKNSEVYISKSKRNKTIM